MTLSLVYGKQMLTRRTTSLYLSPQLPWIILGIGVFVRFYQYMYNPSLWVDEAALALTITNSSYTELFRQPPGFVTSAPVGFLWIEKFAVQSLGNTEFALRLFPLLSGIGSLFLFYAAAKLFIKRSAIPIAMALFSFSTPLVVYSNFVKQYSFDVAASLIVLLVTVLVVKKGLGYRWLALYAITGATLIWFSLPIVLVLAGIGTTLGVSYLVKSQWVKAIQLATVCSVWLVSFAATLTQSAVGQVATNSGYTQQFVRDARFIPIPPRSILDLQWFATDFFEQFYVPVGLTLTGLGAFAFVVGCAVINKESKFRFYLILSPIIAAVLVSAAQYYPFSHRWILFLAPFAIMFIAQGAIFVVDRTKHIHLSIGIAFIGLLLFHPFASEAFRIVEPRGTEQMRQVISYVNVNRMEGDTLYVNRGSKKAFLYYADRFGIGEDEYVMGTFRYDVEDMDKHRNLVLDTYAADIDALRGNSRVWLIFSNVGDVYGVDEEQFYLYNLDKAGTRLDTFRERGAVVYLYDLGTTPAAKMSAEDPQ